MKQKKNTYLFGASMVALTFSFGNNQVAASEGCTTIPSCEELGYEAASCPSGTPALKCPFDQSKVFCAKDCEGYTLTSCPAHAACWTCWNGKMKQYGCETGYIADGENCVVNPCNGYPLTSQNVAHCQSYASCQSGSTMKYACRSCSDGYVAGTLAKINNEYSSGNITSCIANPCYVNQHSSITTKGDVVYYNDAWGIDQVNKWTLTATNDPYCAGNYYATCKSGDKLLYKCTQCTTNANDPIYVPLYANSASSAGKCVPSAPAVYSSVFGWSKSSSFTGASDVYGTNGYYRINKCQTGYHLDGVKCVKD